MHGDLTRDRFNPQQGFTAVRAQQGRVMLDADYNEQVDIQLQDTREGRADVIGPSGAPADDPGFGVTIVSGQPVLGAGDYVVNGIRIRNPTAAMPLAGAQPFLPDTPLPTLAGTWCCYLDVWERSLTAVEEPSIREVALGGPDTTLRDQSVWQVRWLRLGNEGVAANCASAATSLSGLAAMYDGTLEPGLEAGGASGPCIVSDAAQFRGLENQLYRVEIHVGSLNADGGTTGQPQTFKWSRDNGAVVAGVVGLTSTSPLRLQIDRLGPGGAAGFERGGTVEVRDESAVLAGTPGILARVDDVDGDSLRLTLLGGAAVGALQTLLAGTRVVVRRWDSVGAVPVTTAWTRLEDGIRVRFSSGRYRTGDCWLIPARTALLPGTTSQLDWPLTAPNATTYVPLPTRGPRHHRVALAILERNASGAWSFRNDCRQLFPALTSVITLEQAGGEGQHGRSGQWLAAPIAIALTRGRHPVANALVRFRIGSGGGALSLAAPSTNPAGQSQVVAPTDGNGLLRVFWRLGPGPARRAAGDTWESALAQTVDVVRLGADAAPDGATLTFVAQTLDHFNLHIAGGNGQQGRPGEILEVALRARIDDGERTVANAVVEFAVLNRDFAGAPLDQTTGGWILASAAERFVSGETWPGGTRHHTVRTRTDVDGIAQVQWTLGTRAELTTQRVEARLIDAAGNRTDQRGLFLAQLALAGEITWRPLVPWLSAVLTASNHNVQAAIDAIAARLDLVANATTAFDPFLDLQWRATSGQIQPLTETPVPLGAFAAIVFRGDLVPEGRDEQRATAHQGIRVYAEIPVSGRFGAESVVHVTGNVGRAAGRAVPSWEWRLSSEGRGALARGLASNPRGVAVRVTVVPRWLPGGQPTDSSAVHEMLFRLVP